MSNIRIDLIQTTEVEQNSQDVDIEYQFIIGKLFINGHPLLDNYVLNLFALTVIRDTETDFDLYTCSCGIAGCAGIFEKVALVTTENTIAWQLPKQCYANNITIPNEDLIFDKTEYLQELDRILACLKNINKTENITIAPSSMPADDCIQINTFAAEYAQAQKRLISNIQINKEYIDNYGELLNHNLYIKWPSQIWQISLEYLAYIYTEHLNITKLSKREHYIKNTLKQRLLDPTTDISSYLNSLGIQALHDIAHITHVNPTCPEDISLDTIIVSKDVEIRNKFDI